MIKKTIKVITAFLLTIFITLSCGFEDNLPCDDSIPECNDKPDLPNPDTEG